MNKKYKMVVFDVDGTIMKYGEQKISSNVIKAINKLREKEYIVVIATGRDDISIGDVLEQVKVDYFIGANGSFCVNLNNNTRVIKKSIDYDDYQFIYNNFFELENNKEKFNNIILSDDKNVFIKNKKLLENHWFWKNFKEKFKDLEEAKRFLNREDFNLITINTNDSIIIEETKTFLSNIKTSLYVQAFWSNGFFISQKKVNKGTTINELADLLGIDMREVVSFGDGENDIEMTQMVGLGVVMFNANDKIKKYANKITNKGVDEDGTYYFLLEEGIL